MTKHHKDWHHRLCRSQGGTNTPENLSRVSVSKHRAWHNLFSNLMPKDIALVINSVWIPKSWRMVAFEVKPRVHRKKVVVLYEDSECKVIMKEK